MLDYKESVKNILSQFTQDEVDLWCFCERIKPMPLASFIENFNDYSKEGLSSLLATKIAMFPSTSKDEVQEEDNDSIIEDD